MLRKGGRERPAPVPGSGRICFLAAIALLGLAACAAVPGDDNPEDPGAIDEHSELFVQDGATWVFETNDPAYWSSAGYTLWARNGTSHAAGETWDRSFLLTKESGDPAAGYGILFGYDSGPTMLVVMINLQGQYCIGEVADGLFQMLQDWTVSSDLQATEDVADTVRIRYEGGTQTYAVFLGANPAACCSFQDTVTPYHDGGEEGFLAVISYNDEFPETPVRVLYEEP